MEITAFSPLIMTPDANEAIELFEALGFERAHMKTGINGEIDTVDLKDANGFRVDVAQVDNMPQNRGAVTIRLNVRDFDEAYDFLTARGFKNVQGEKVTDTGSSKVTLMVSPGGYAISLAQHIRKDDEE